LNEVWARHTHDVKEQPQRISYFKKRGIQAGVERMAPPLYSQYPIPIKKAKAGDLTKLVSSYVPLKYQHFYAELPCCDGSDSSDED